MDSVPPESAPPSAGRARRRPRWPAITVAALSVAAILGACFWLAGYLAARTAERDASELRDYAAVRVQLAAVPDLDRYRLVYSCDDVRKVAYDPLHDVVLPQAPRARSSDAHLAEHKEVLFAAIGASTLFALPRVSAAMRGASSAPAEAADADRAHPPRAAGSAPVASSSDPSPPHSKRLEAYYTVGMATLAVVVGYASGVSLGTEHRDRCDDPALIEYLQSAVHWQDVERVMFAGALDTLTNGENLNVGVPAAAHRRALVHCRTDVHARASSLRERLDHRGWSSFEVDDYRELYRLLAATQSTAADVARVVAAEGPTPGATADASHPVPVVLSYMQSRAAPSTAACGEIRRAVAAAVATSENGV
jgi:hypothetical protein